MSNQIHKLDEHLSNMIAAGEVVERPQGVVKELVENAIDAGASQIQILIEQGGIEKITIVDNGKGMSFDDAALAFERHATSKINDVDDLWSIQTMGFRGEALPSIAAVSHVSLKSRTESESTLVEVSYGERKEHKQSAAQLGTTIEVAKLFQKTPARFKHLKSMQYEFSLIQDVVQKFALAYPEIGFTLIHDGKDIFRSSGNGNLQEVLYQIYGKDVAKDAIAINISDSDYTIEGYAAQPSVNRATKYYMLIYINRRMVRSYRLQKAISDSYQEYMPKDRNPIVVLNITMDATLVDVNVHPSKWEIRLSKEKQLESLIYKGLSDALKEELQVPQLKMNTEKEKIKEETFEFSYQTNESTIDKIQASVSENFTKIEDLPSLDFEKIRRDVEEKKYPNTSVITGEEELIKYPKGSVVQAQMSQVEEPTQGYNGLKTGDENEVFDKAASGLNEHTEEQAKTNEGFEEVEIPQNPSFPHMEVIGQFHGNYILAQGDAGLYIIDQHAAQEKFHFEQIRRRVMRGEHEMQALLIPISLAQEPKVIALVDDINKALNAVSIHVELFSDTSFVVRELPTWMQGVSAEKVIQDMIDYYVKDGDISIDKIRKYTIATMACHSSIRFNHRLSIEQMKQVIEDLKQCEQPFHCPHGRPTFILVKDEELFKQFERA